METTHLNNDGFYEKFANCDWRPDSWQIVELKLKNLPPTATSEDIKATAGAKHIIETTTDIDNIKNECTGTGKFQCRLGEGETKEQIVQRFKNQGIEVENPNNCTRKVNNYKDLSTTNWKDHRLQVQERRLQDQFGKFITI